MVITGIENLRKELRKDENTLTSLMNSEKTKKQIINRNILKTIAEVVRTLAAQNLPFRGHRDARMKNNEKMHQNFGSFVLE